MAESSDAAMGEPTLNSHAATIEQFTQWLRAYQAAWEGRDAAAAARLFTDDARYYWTPLVPPQKGPAEIAAAWDSAVSKQRDIRFTFEVFAVSGPTGFATWRADFVRQPDQSRVQIEGVLSAEFGAAGRCRVFREWWHSSEAPG
jgi:ketosteroid isomerase-like protein